MKCSGDTLQTRAASLLLPPPAFPLTQGTAYLEYKSKLHNLEKTYLEISPLLGGSQKEKPLSTGDLLIFVINTAQETFLYVFAHGLRI